MPAANKNRRTEYRYNADGRLVEMTAINATTGDQVTRWEYGTTLAWPATIWSGPRFIPMTWAAATASSMNTTASAN